MPTYVDYNRSIEILLEWAGDNSDRFFDITVMPASQRTRWEVTLYPEGEGWCKGRAASMRLATSRAMKNFEKNKREYPLGYSHAN